MSVSLVLIGIAAITGAVGTGKTIKAGVDQKKASDLNLDSNTRIEKASTRLEILRKQCGTALGKLGEEKIYVLEKNMGTFLDVFTKIKNVDFETSIGLEELEKLHIDSKEFEELGEMRKFAVSVAKGVIAGGSGGAMTALGAYNLAATFATASTGTAISSLSGAAASNATLAFFGGGSIASGGLGVAGGSAVLGGLVAGPALLIMGIVSGNYAGKELENAKANAAQADEICEQLETGAMQCIAIRRRTTLYYNLLARMDSYFLPLIFDMKDIVEQEGYDYSSYSSESKKKIASCASAAVTIKAILDTPILTEDGVLTEESEEVGVSIQKKMK